MDRHPDVIDVLTHARIVDLFATASSTRAHRAATPAWRRLAGAALVRLGEAILGDARPTNRPISLNTPGIAR